MQNFSTASVPPSGPKNYVFVDEHNRHKRLKVMRACEGCRRRKIKCDSATTNTWPCAACVRLKLQCVPPVGGLEGEAGNDGVEFDESSGASSFIPAQVGQLQSASYQTAAQQMQLGEGDPFPYGSYAASYQKPSYEAFEKSYGTYYPSPQQFPGTVNDTYQHDSLLPQSQFEPPPLRKERTDSSPSDQLTAEDLMEHLGTLKIGENGVAPYLRPDKSSTKEPEAPLQEAEPEFKLTAAFRTDAGSQIRIPPALMPSDEDALEAFQKFFQDVHPYVPVLCRSHFYDQWHDDRASISPLVLEAVFANAGRYGDDPAQGAQWLALANSKLALIHLETTLTSEQSMRYASWIFHDSVLCKPYFFC
jgi:hypothetical protein